MHKIDFNWLFVILAHFLNTHFVNVLLVLISERTQEVSKFPSDRVDNFVFGDPAGNIFTLVIIVIQVCEVWTLFIVVHVSSLSSGVDHGLLWILVIGHESSSLSLLSSLIQTSLLIHFFFSLPTLVHRNQFLLSIVDAILIISIQSRIRFIIPKDKQN